MAVEGLSVGRIVHVTGNRASPCMAAIVVDVRDKASGRVNLAGFDPIGTRFSRLDVAHSEEPAPNTWHWPERAT